MTLLTRMTDRSPRTPWLARLAASLRRLRTRLQR